MVYTGRDRRASRNGEPKVLEAAQHHAEKHNSVTSYTKGV